ncbi:predicted protein [Naegleria gruberi]|uniref:Predicted protein n=1 Tax=Naegleria gruberi TaxID=5762 RepID=D2UXC9_NAEGR|nr:uncharacterized protein NAEGRDRAFT_61080 [Naegleria gruberi]EFC50611.1 predicted protein [Naegleria gruberi]|eukprot:XP_002683355.1 predicted protein [Naegleria gruberi strain NEG-M]
MNELLSRLKLDLKNNSINNNNINHYKNNFDFKLFNSERKHTDLDTKGNTTNYSTTQSIYESEIIELKNDEQLVVDGSGSNGRLGKIGADGRHLLVLIKLLEDTLRVSVFMSSPTNENDTVEEVYELENFSSRKPHIFITTEGGTGGNGCPTSQLFGDSFDNSSNESIMGKDGGDGGNVTIVIEEHIKYLLDEQYLKICCEGGNGGDPYIESSFGDFDVNSIVLPPEVPLSTITSQSSVLTFSKLSFFETPSHTGFSGYQTKTKNNSIWKGVNGRKGRSGVIKYIVVSKQTGDVIEQANTTFSLRVMSFNVKIVANAIKEKSLGHNLILEDDNFDSSELDLVDPTHFIEPGCELAITDIEIKNTGGLSAPDYCFIEFEGNDFADVLGFSNSLKLNQSSESNNQLTLPTLSGGESVKLPLPLRLLVGKQVKQPQQITSQSCCLSYSIRKKDGLTLSQGQLCDMPIYYPLSLSSFDCPSALGISNNSQKFTISIENKTEHTLIGSSIKVYITNKDVDTERIFTDNVFLIQETGNKFDRHNSQMDPELSIIESISSIPQDMKVIEKDLAFTLEKKLTERVTTLNFALQILNHKKIDEETLGFRKFHLIIELEYKGNTIERKVQTIVLIPDKSISSNYHNTNLGKALLVTDSNHLTSKAYLYYKRLLRSIGFALYVWDSRYHGDDKNNRDIFPYFKDSLILVTLFTTSSDTPKYERIVSHFNNSTVTPNESGLLYVTGYPYSLDSSDYRNQLFEHNAQNYSKNFHIIDSKYLSIFYPIEKPSKTLFLDKVNNYLEKKRDQSPYLLMKIHKKEFFENLKYRMPRRIKIGDASINILPIKSNDRIFCVKFTTSKIASNNIPEFSPDILTSYHKFSFNSKTFALLFGTIMSSSMQQKVNLLLNRFTEKEWQFCDNKSLKSESSSSSITIRDISLFSIYFEIIQELFLKENLLYRFKLLVKCISDCFTNTPSIAESDKEQLLQYVKILLDKLRYESSKIPTQDKAISLKKKEFLKYYTQLRKVLVEKCRLVINNNKKKSASSKRMYKMLGGETLQVKKKQFDDNCRYLLQFILKPSSEWYDDSSLFRFQKNKWSFERMLLDSEERESQTLPLLF